VSKLQAALEKISASRDALVATKRLDSDIQKPKKAVDGQRDIEANARCYNKSIEIDFQALAAEGIAISSEASPELRDEMRRIKWPVLANAFGEQSATISRGNMVMVASALSGDGKTFMSVNLAMSIASEKEVQVLLVDADIAKPHTSDLFGIRDFPGVIDYLSGEVSDVADIIVGTDIPGLSLLPAGRADEHAPELMASKRMSMLVAALNERIPRTVILFDTAPILETNESQVLSRLAGQVLLVVAANKTPQPAIHEAVSLLGPDLIVNIVFNRMRSLFRQKYRYGGYYGYQNRR
jgi:exopolysaccharide/PEP-CTERM locus tyrosine autokinase